MRSQLLRMLKGAIHWAAASPLGEKMLRLVAEEYAVHEGGKATRAAAPPLRATLAPVVLRGPCAGLRYPMHESVGSTYWPKLLGSYECELAPTIDAIVARGYSHIVDIGAAEGYYAVGIARRLPGAEVIAFEADPIGQRLLRDMAELNGCDIRVAGWCDLAALQQLAPALPPRRTFILCDAESAEYDLLDPGAVPAMAQWDFLVELHRRRLIADPRAWILARFGETHDVHFVESEPRIPSAYPELSVLPPQQRGAVLFERTDPFGWAVLMAKGRK